MKSTVSHKLFSDNFERTAYKSMDSDMWELYIPPLANGDCPIRHMTQLKVNFFTSTKAEFDKKHGFKQKQEQAEIEL